MQRVVRYSSIKQQKLLHLQCRIRQDQQEDIKILVRNSTYHEYLTHSIYESFVLQVSRLSTSPFSLLCVYSLRLSSCANMGDSQQIHINIEVKIVLNAMKPWDVSEDRHDESLRTDSIHIILGLRLG